MTTDVPGAQPVTELVTETAVETDEPDELTFTPEEWTGFTKRLKRRLAAAAETGEINGGSTLHEIRAYFVTRRALRCYDTDAVPPRDTADPRRADTGESYRPSDDRVVGSGRTLQDFRRDANR